MAIRFQLRQTYRSLGWLLVLGVLLGLVMESRSQTVVLPDTGPVIESVHVGTVMLARPTAGQRYDQHLSFNYRERDGVPLRSLIVSRKDPRGGRSPQAAIDVAMLGLTGKKSGTGRYTIGFTAQDAIGEYTYTLQLVDANGRVSLPATVRFSLIGTGVAPIRLFDMSPSTGRPGDVIYLRGKGLQAPPRGHVSVEFGNVPAELRFEHPNLIGAIVPEHAPSAPLRITTDSGSVSTTVPFLSSNEKYRILHFRNSSDDCPRDYQSPNSNWSCTSLIAFLQTAVEQNVTVPGGYVDTGIPINLPAIGNAVFVVTLDETYWRDYIYYSGPRELWHSISLAPTGGRALFMPGEVPTVRFRAGPGPADAPVEMRFAILASVLLRDPSPYSATAVCPDPLSFGLAVNTPSSFPYCQPVAPVLLRVTVMPPASMPTPDAVTAVTRVLPPSPYRVAPGEFEVVTRWSVARGPAYGDWSGWDNARLEHVWTRAPDGSTAPSHDFHFGTGVTELRHRFRVRDDAPPGRAAIRFHLYDTSATPADAYLDIDVDRADVQGRVVHAPAGTVMPEERFAIDTEWSLPEWVVSPTVEVSTNGFALEFESSCVFASCFPSRTVAVHDGVVSMTTWFRATPSIDPADNWVTRFAEVQFAVRDGQGQRHASLTQSVQIRGQPRIEVSGSVSPCGNALCVRFSRTPPLTARQAIITIANRGSEDLSYTVSHAGAPFERSQSPGGWLGTVPSAALGRGFYYNAIPVTLEFLAPEAGGFADACTRSDRDLICERSITISSNDPDRPTIRLRLIGAVDPSPRLAIEGDVGRDDAVDFGLVTVGQSARREIRIINRGGQFLDGDLPAALPVASGGFTYEAPVRHFRLGAGESLTVALAAAPTARGEYRTPFEVWAVEDSRTISRRLTLHAITGPELQVFDRSALNAGANGRELHDGERIDLGSVSLGAPFQPHRDNAEDWVPGRPVTRTLLLLNASAQEVNLNVEMSLLDVGQPPEWTLIGGPLFGDVTALPNLVLGPGEALPIALRFDPHGDGTHTATLQLRSDAANHASPLTVTLDATVVRPPGSADIELLDHRDASNDRTIDFGAVVLNHIAHAQLAAHNAGQPESVLSVGAELAAASGPSGSVEPSTFALRPFSGAPLPLAIDGPINGQQRGDLLIVDFRPGELGPFATELTLTTSDPELPTVTYAVHGEGVRYSVPSLISIEAISEPLALSDQLAQSWHAFDGALRVFLGFPGASNWATYAKHLVRHLSGEQQHLRALARLMLLFADAQARATDQCEAAIEVDNEARRRNGLPEEVVDAAASCRQQFQTGSPSLDHVLRESGLITVLTSFETLDSMFRSPLWRAVEQETGIPPYAAAGAVSGQPQGRIGQCIADHWLDVQARLHALSQRALDAEVEAYGSIAGAYRDFLAASNADPSGIAPAMSFVGDTYGFLAAGMQLYAEAKRLGDQVRALGAGPAAEALLAEREAQVRRATEFLALHHQLVVQAALFDPIANDFREMPAFTLRGPRGPEVLVANWADFNTRMGIDPATVPSNPYAMTASTAPPLLALEGTIGGWINQHLADNDYWENPARVPLPHAASLQHDALESLGAGELVGIFNESLHVVGPLMHNLHLPQPNDAAIATVFQQGLTAADAVHTTADALHAAADAAGKVSSFCAAASLLGGAVHNHSLHFFGELCSTLGAGAEAATGNPVAILSAAILFMQATAEVAAAMVDMQVYFSCWPNCVAPLMLSEWIYR